MRGCMRRLLLRPFVQACVHLHLLRFFDCVDKSYVFFCPDILAWTLVVENESVSLAIYLPAPGLGVLGQG